MVLPRRVFDEFGEELEPGSVSETRVGRPRKEAGKLQPKYKRIVHTLQPCDWCGQRFEITHKKDRFCDKACNNAWHHRERKEALAAFKLQTLEEQHRLRILSASSDFINSAPARQIEPKPNFADKLTKEEIKAEYPGDVRLGRGSTWQCPDCFTNHNLKYGQEKICFECGPPKPNFKCSEAVVPTPQTETWQCLECNQRWPLECLYCTCQPKPIDLDSDF